MKNIITLFTLLILTLTACKAQTPIVEIDARYKTTPLGGYFKDINNEFDKFTGTWLFSDGNNSFILVLEKKEMIYDGDEYYEDLIVGEYQYIENSNIIVNTIPSLIDNPDDIDSRNIVGRNIIPTNLYVPCDDCSENERRVELLFSDPERDYLSVSIILRYSEGVSNPEQLTANIISTDSSMLPSEDSPTSTRVPYGEYIMTKE